MPQHDDTTFYCSEWGKKIIEHAKRKGINVIDLQKERANRKNVEGILKNKQPKLVLFNGHGDNETVMGHKNEIIIKSSLNEELLKFKIIHALSCGSGGKLGKDAVDKGTTSYIGYENDFFFNLDTNKSAKPLNDNIAKPFFESANQVPISLVDGKTTEEAVIKSQKSYEFWITYYRLHGGLPEAPSNLIALMWNKASQVLHGEKEATF